MCIGSESAAPVQVAGGEKTQRAVPPAPPRIQPARPEEPDRRASGAASRIFPAGAMAAGAAAALALFFFDPSRTPVYPACIFHRVTGLDCPGCGGLRAAHQLLHGHVIPALHYNAMAVLSAPVFAAAGLRFLFLKMKNRPMKIPLRWIVVYAAAWVAFGVLRNLPVPALASFAP